MVNGLATKWPHPEDADASFKGSIMGQSFGDQIRFLANVFGISCVIAAYWTLIPIAARFVETSALL